MKNYFKKSTVPEYIDEYDVICEKECIKNIKEELQKLRKIFGDRRNENRLVKRRSS